MRILEERAARIREEAPKAAEPIVYELARLLEDVIAAIKDAAEVGGLSHELLGGSIKEAQRVAWIRDDDLLKEIVRLVAVVNDIGTRLHTIEVFVADRVWSGEGGEI